MQEPARDPRLVRSQRSLTAAMASLLASVENPSEITITAVVLRAGVSRPTFYKHFPDISALARHAALGRTRSALEAIPRVDLGKTWDDFTRGTLERLLTSFAQDARFYQNAWQISSAMVTADFTEQLAAHLLHESPLGPIIRRREGPDSAELRAQFLAAGSVWLVMRWLMALDTDVPPRVDDAVDQISGLLIAASGATEDEIASVGIGRRRQS